MALSRPVYKDTQGSAEAYMDQNVCDLGATHYKVAKSLELCYLRGFNQPEFSKEICGHATNARALQELCSGLMKKFGTNAREIANEGIPSIIELLEIGEKAIVIGYFDEVIGQAREMSREADDTTQRCIKISVDVGQSRGNVKREQAIRQKELVHVESDKRREMIRRTSKEREAQELEKMVDDYLCKISGLERNKKDIKDDMEKILKDISDRLKTPSGVLSLGVYFLVDIMRYSGKAVSFHVKSMAVSKLQLKQQEHQKEKDNVDYKLSELTQNLDVLSIESGRLKNEHDVLLGVFPLLTKVQDYLTQLRSFWDATAALLIGFKQRAETNRYFYDNATQPLTTKLIKRNLEKLERSFDNFGKMCDVYVHGCEHDPKLAVKDLFAFLDGRVESMGQTDLNTKIKSINAELNIPDDDDDDDDNDDE